MTAAVSTAVVSTAVVSTAVVSTGAGSTGTGSRRDRLWNACADKTCCRTTRVHVTGADLGRLVEALELPAVSLITAVPLRPPEDRNGFRLWRDGPPSSWCSARTGRSARPGHRASSS